MLEGINELEVKTQNRLLHSIFEEKLNYTYLGNFKDKINTNIEYDLLLKYLLRSYNEKTSKSAIDKLKSIANNESKSIYEVNKEVYNLLKYGISINITFDSKSDRVFFIDFEHIENNDFYVAEEVTVKDKNEKRPDIVVYVNGIALAIIELKRSTVSINEGIRQNLDNQSPEFIERFFSTVQFIIAGNDTEGIMYGTNKTKAKYYLKWKEDITSIDKVHEVIKSMIDPSALLIDKQIISLFEKDRFIDLINNFILFDAGVKKVPRYNQYFGVSNAREFVKKHEGGIIWHTQGSGKSISMVYLAKWILSNMDNSRVLIFTDRKELDKQIEDNFINTGEENTYRAKSCNDLLKVLNKSEKRLICSLIHKVGTSVDETSDKTYSDYVKQLSEFKNNSFEAKDDIFVFVDECHRSQAGKLHQEMKRILPSATFIGFTGTPLLKKDKANTLEQFGKPIHTYLFNQAVEDGVIVDLTYESRNVEQFIGNPEKIDEWFESKTSGLNDFARQKLKARWSTLQNVTSSKDRLEKIAKDIIFDFQRVPRLASGKGTALLAASNIYEACKYWEVFQNLDFKKCAVISSYNPYIADIKGEEDGEFTQSDKQKIYEVYQEMWDKNKYPKLRSESENDNYSQCFEDNAIHNFINNPSEMQLLIVVDRLLTGFDAPTATYLYIDKHMQDHGLFQAICRVNRLDDNKDLGYIVDYKKLFKDLKQSVDTYTGGAFEGYNDCDISGLLKNRLVLAKERLNSSIKEVEIICENVDQPRFTLDFLHYFVSKELDIQEEYKNTEPRRAELYDSVSDLIIAYSNIADEMSNAGYNQDEIRKIKEKVKYYSSVKDEVMKAAGDYIELKNYDSSMRYMIDNYINSKESESDFKLGETTLLDIIEVSGVEAAKQYLPNNIKKDKKAVALTIESNIASTIIQNTVLNPRYYSKMSELLNELIQLKKDQDLDYQDYIKKLIDLVHKVKSPEKSGYYPNSINNVRLRGLYDIIDKDENNSLIIYSRLNEEIAYDFMDTKLRQREAKIIISGLVNDDEKTDEIFNLWKNTRGY